MLTFNIAHLLCYSQCLEEFSNRVVDVDYTKL